MSARAMLFVTLVGILAPACDDAPTHEPQPFKTELTGAGGGGSTTDVPFCPPFEERSCWCDKGYYSVQTCSESGASWGACDCSDECKTDQDCDPWLCEPAQCVNGTCERSALPDGTVVLTSPAGDCAVQVCETLPNGDHYAVFADDETDTPDDSNPCTVDWCAGWGPAHAPEQQGTACPGGACDGMGQCVPSPP